VSRDGRRMQKTLHGGDTLNHEGHMPMKKKTAEFLVLQVVISDITCRGLVAL
jgi:hypothetical protein